MKNYVIQDGCHNCESVFVKREWDVNDEYYCCYGAKKRPVCGSVLGEEIPDNPDKKTMQEFLEKHSQAYSAERQAWRKWSESRRTDRAGICELWSEGEDQ